MNWKQNLYRVITSAIKSKPHKIYSLIAKMFLSRILKLIKKQICVEPLCSHVFSARLRIFHTQNQSVFQINCKK